MKQTQPARVRIGTFELDLRSGELRANDQKTVLQEQPLQILRMLVEREGEIVSREEIRKKLWPNDTIVEFDHSINAAIKNLRRALGDSADEPKFIETLARRGYRLMVAAERVSTDDSSGAVAAVADGGAVRLQPEPSLLGKKVAHYRVMEVIGAGGMGLVYKAEDLKLGRQVALKFLPEELLTDPAALQRFEREAQTASSLNHPNICTIHEIEEHEAKPFIVMELLQGETLRDRLSGLAGAKKTLSLDDLVDIAVQICSGLEAAHAKSIIHRDIKPANIFLLASGQAKILDFGVAKLVEAPDFSPAKVNDEDIALQTGPGLEPNSFDDPHHRGEAHPSATPLEATLTRTGAALGTIGYMSPEQVRGEKLDARTDLFSLGLVLYEMATGQRAFSGQTQAVLHNEILNSVPVPVHELNSTLPPKLEAVIAKALEKDCNLRYQSAAEMRAGLQELKQDSQGARTSAALQAAGSSVPRAVAQSVKRHAVIYAVIACALAALVALMMTGVIRNPFPPKPQERHLAVLPFLNIGNDPTDKAFAEGISETLTSKLSQLERFDKSFWVVPAGDARTMKSPDEAHRNLDVTLAITGSVERTPDGVQVSTNLIDAANHRQLASRTLNVPSISLEDLQQQVWEAVADMLDLQVPAEVKKELAAGGTSHPEAYRLYEQGNGFLQRYTTDDVDHAIDLFNKVLAIDPKYALAYAGLGDAYGWKYYDTKDPQWIVKATQNASRAVELNDQLIPARMSLAKVYERIGQPDKALAEYKRVLEQDPTVTDAETYEAKIYESQGHFGQAEEIYKHAIARHASYGRGHADLGELYYSTGRFDEAIQQFQTAIDLSPDNPVGYFDLGASYIALGRYDDAIAVLKKGLSIKPSADAWTNLGGAYMYLGKWDEAADAMKRATELSPHDHVMWRNLGDAYDQIPSRATDASQAYHKALELATEQLKVNPKDSDALSSIALYYAHLGQKDQAETFIGRALEVAPKDSQNLFTAALVYEIVGHREQALSAVEQAVKAGYSLEEVEKEPELRKLRTDPRYQRWLGSRSEAPKSKS